LQSATETATAKCNIHTCCACAAAANASLPLETRQGGSYAYFNAFLGKQKTILRRGPTVADEPNATHTKSYQISKEADGDGINKEAKYEITITPKWEKARERGPEWVYEGQGKYKGSST